MPQSTIKAVALCRVSTSKQRIYGNSLDAQEKRILEASNTLNVLLPDEYIWRKDVSSRKGKNLNRKDIREIFATCKNDRKIKYFIVDEPDRFMRSIEEYYWWKVEFKRIGVSLVFAHKPLATDNDQNHIFDELIDVYRAESSNQERSRKANDKMQARIDDGYYPGFCRTGYTTSDIKGLHIPREPEFTLLQSAYRDVVYGRKTIPEAVRWLTDSGFRLRSSKRIDTSKFKRILKEPYYYGAVSMGKFTLNEHGRHQPMVTKEEWEIANRIARGVKAKFTVNRHNPLFPLNGLLCQECYFGADNKKGKFTGYEHSNGKRGGANKRYRRYHCRNCGKSFLRDDLHADIGAFVDNVKLDEAHKQQLKVSLRKAWAEIEQEALDKIRRLKAKLELTEAQKTNLIMSLAENPELKDDLREVIAIKKEEISSIASELDNAQDIEADFNEFVEFALDFVDNLKANWWELDHEDRLRCEQLIFPQYLRINEKRKVSTPEISAIYRYGAKQKDLASSQVVLSGGSGGA